MEAELCESPCRYHQPRKQPAVGFLVPKVSGFQKLGWAAAFVKSHHQVRDHAVELSKQLRRLPC
jgi:hypothetical protein